MKKLRIVLIILAVIVAVTAALCIWQWQNINAVVDSIRYDEQQLEQQAQQSEKDIADYLENNQIGTIRPLTEEESAAVTSGEITEQDAVKISTGKLTLEEAKQNKAQQDKVTSDNTSDKPAESQKPTETSQPKPADKSVTKPRNDTATSKPSEENEEKQPEQEKQPEEPEEVDYDTLISEKVAQLYVVKANFYAEFNNAWATQKALYLQLPKSERSRAKKASIVKSYMGEGLAMEQKYDAQVEAIITELKTLLTEAGRGTELADSIRAAYNQEKKAKKAQLINKYFG